MDRKQFATIAVGCAAVMIIGCLALTWPSLDFGDKLDGMDAAMRSKLVDTANTEASKYANNVGPLILGIGAGALALLVMLGMTGLVPLDARQLLFIACGLFVIAGLLAFFSPYSFDSGVSDRKQDLVSRGFGVWLTALAAFGGAAASFLATTKKKGKAAPKPAAAEAPAEAPAADVKPTDDEA